MLEHKHLIVRAEVNRPPFEESQLVDWIKELIDGLGMNVLYGPFAMRCDLENNEGFTAGAVLSTSHCMVHTWDRENPTEFQLDVYTCSDLDLDFIWFMLSRFDPSKVEYKFLDRKNGLRTITENCS